VSGLTLPFVDTEQLKRRVGAFSEDRPGVYRMLDETGRVIYVGKAKRVRTRLMSYFRANSLENKQARILNATQDIAWDYAPSEFAAYVRELREIKRHKPPFNVRMNRSRNVGFIKVSSGAAPKIYVGTASGAGDEQVYGPFRSVGKLKEAVRVLNLQLGLRDCAMNMPITYSEQADLFDSGRRAACLRHPLGTCTGPCGGFVSEADYRSRVDTAVAFLEGRAIDPLDRVVAAMSGASNASKYEDATRWRDRFDALEWLFAAGNRVRGAIEGLSFIYTDPGTYGDDRAYLIKRATIRATAPAPRTPIEISAFRSLVSEHVGQEGSAGPLPATAIDEMVLLLGWFRKHPAALGRTVALEEWLEMNGGGD
jgi:excinuclease ABC subunit C